MEDLKSQKCFPFKSIFLSALIFIGLMVVAVRFVPWDRVNWGKLEMLPGSAITVTGEAKQDLQTQIARFTAGVTAENEDKQTAIDEVNQKMAAIIAAVKDFGIPEKDIQTQMISVYQTEDQPVGILPLSAARTTVKKWRASNSIEIILRNPDQASALADLLNTTEATNIYGPSFSIDDTEAAELELLQKAIDNAREKGEEIAKASGRKLGKVLSVTEGTGYVPGPLYRALSVGGEGAAPTPVEPGTETLTKTVTVVFELN
jgi:uncharacterized protein YggE